MKLRTAAGVLAALLLSACSTSDSGVNTVPPVTAPYTAFDVNTHGADQDATVEASRAAMDILTGEGPASRVMSPRSTLSEAEAGATAALNSTDGLSETAAASLRQIVASVMVHRHLEAADPDMEAVGRYTQILLDEGSPNAHLLARSLPALEATWGRARVHAAAEQGITEAEAFLGKTCPACNAPALARSQKPTSETAAAGAVGSQRAIQDGITALEAL